LPELQDAGLNRDLKTHEKRDELSANLVISANALPI
jgi:hypothetical protein